MKQIFYETVGTVSKQIGFCYRTVFIHNENSSLHSHDFYEVFLTLAEKVHHNINDSVEMLKRGTLVFIRKEDTHCYEYVPNQEPSFINISFTEQILQEMFSYLTEGFPSAKLLANPHPPQVMLNETDIRWLQKQIKILNSSSASDIALLKYRCRLLLIKIFSRYFAQVASGGYNTERIPLWLIQLDTQMQKIEHFSQPSDHMVQMSGRCRAYLGRMLKQHYGKTIPDYINDLRLNYWANSLLTSDAPVIDLCYECGFENVGYAYSLFKNKYGVSPLKYRKTNYKE